MKQKEGGQKLRNFLPGQVFLSHDKEPVEIKQSRSNGCLGGSEMSALKKHISLEKIIQSIPMKSRSKISLKESFKKAGKVSAKEGNGESLPESRIRIGLASYNESQKEVTSPLTPSRALPLKTDHDFGSASQEKNTKRESYKPKLTFDSTGSASQKFIKTFVSPTNTKQQRVGIGKNMSDLTGGKGRTTRTRQVVSNFGVLEKVQSNLSNKSGIKILDGSTTKFSFTALDFHRSVKMEKYKLDKLLGKESNKSAVFLTSKGCISGTNNFIIGQNPKEKQFNAQRCGRNGRGNSPQPQIELLRKGGYGSYTSSTLQTVSMMNTESPNKGKQMVLSTARLCCSKLVSIEWQGEECNIVQFEEDYEQTGFLSRSITPNLEEGTENLQKPLKGHNLNETSESKFFLPKASLISVTGCSSIDICNVMGSPNFDVKEPETIEAQGIQEENEAGEEYTYCEPGYALGLLNTPSFTVDCRSDDFTFGKGESKDEAQAGNKQQAESAVSSMNIDYDKQEVLSDVGYNFASSESKDRRIQTQREFAQGNHSTASDSGFPLSERDCTSKTSKNQAILRITNAIKSSNLSQDLRLQGLEELRSADRSLNKGNLDYQDSAEDSERFNLYKNIYVSDSEDADYDVPRSDILSESGASSQKGRIYNRIDDAIDLDSNQLFLDDELRAKYQTLLQNN